MPNVIGLEPATSLLSAYPAGSPQLAYGPHAYVVIDGGLATLSAVSDHRTLATFNGVRAQAALNRIDGDVITAVNAFLKPQGKVKAYWRAKPGENPYRWHPVSGAATPVRRTSAPKPTTKATPVTPKPTPVAPVAADPAPIKAPVVVHPATSPVIETAMTWRDQYTKRPVAKAATKTYSMVGDVLMPSVDLRVLDSIKRQRDAGQPAHGLITGPRGTAKTKVVTQWAFVNDLPVVIVPGQSIQTADDWFGSTLPATSGDKPFEWVWSDAALMIMSGMPCVIILDEINRAENERALNGVMGLLDWRAVAKPLGAPSPVRLSPGQIIIATLNEGIEYTGTVEVDAAVRDRFSTGGGIRMAYTSERIETRILLRQVPTLDPVVAKRLALIGAAQRAKVVAADGDESFPSGTTLSTRALVGIGDKIVTGGLSPVEAIWAVARATFQPADEKGLRALIESQFGADAPALNDDLADDDEIDAFLAADGF